MPEHRAPVDPADATGLYFAAPPESPIFAPPDQPDEIGRLGPYRVVKELGRGGMGIVYSAIDTRLERKVALKVMLGGGSTGTARERFLREARAAACITHDNVVTIYEADERDGVPYIAMQLLEGASLDRLLERAAPLMLPEVLHLAHQVAAGLAAAHAVGLVHRDIKPANLWLESPDNRVKVLDFGLARPVEGNIELTDQGIVTGTPGYMSPEQARGEAVDHRTDLFSFGVVLYRLLTGQLPFSGANPMAVLTAVATSEAVPIRERNPSVPEPVAALIHELLANSPADRPQSAQVVKERFEALSADAPRISLPATPAAESREVSPIWPVLGLAALVAFAVIGAIIINPFRQSTPPPNEPPGVIQSPPPVVVVTPDRVAAEYTLAVGGRLKVAGSDRFITAAAELPSTAFTLVEVEIAGGNGSTAVTDMGLKCFKECKTLTHLTLGGSQVTDEGLDCFDDCEDLARLSVRGTSITDKSLEELEDRKRLTSLDATNTQVTAQGVAKLATALPHCTITWNQGIVGPKP